MMKDRGDKSLQKFYNFKDKLEKEKISIAEEKSKKAKDEEKKVKMKGVKYSLKKGHERRKLEKEKEQKINISHKITSLLSHPMSDWEKLEEIGYINEVLEEGERTGDLESMKYTIQLWNYLKKWDLAKQKPSVERRVLRILEKYSSNHPGEKIPGNYLRMAEEFLKQGVESRKKKLENKVLPVITVIGLGAGIAFMSTTISGNAIGSLNQTASNGIGALLFVAGLVGAFFCFRKK